MPVFARAARLFNRNVRLFYVTVVLMGLTLFGGLYSLLMNLYMLRLGYGTEFIGLVHAVGTLGWAAACLPAGRVGRRLGNRRALMAGMGLAAIAYGLLPLADVTPGSWRSAWLVVTYLAGNVLIALYDVHQGPFLMAITTRPERDRAFSVQSALWPLAGFTGSMVGGFLPGVFSGLLGVPDSDPAPYRYPLLIAALLLLGSVWALHRAREPAEHDPPEPRVTEAAMDPASARRGPLSLIVFLSTVVVLQGMGEGACRTFFNVYMDNGLGVATSRIGVLAAVGQLLGVPAALAMPLMASRFGHRRTFVWGSLGMAAALLPLALITSAGAAGAGYMAAIAMASIVRPALSVYLMESVPPSWRTTMSAAVTMALGLSWALISLGGGYLIAAMGYRVFFLASAAITVSGVILFIARVDTR
jgi:MFS family permease